MNYTLNGRACSDTPDELFNKFNGLTTHLPDDATLWSIQLCSCFLNALSKDLVDQITTEPTFKMPDLTTLTTKALQLEALRCMRQVASLSYKALVK